MKGVGLGCLKSKMNLDWAKFDPESPKTILLGLPRPEHQIIHFFLRDLQTWLKLSKSVLQCLYICCGGYHEASFRYKKLERSYQKMKLETGHGRPEHNIYINYFSETRYFHVFIYILFICRIKKNQMNSDVTLFVANVAVLVNPAHVSSGWCRFLSICMCLGSLLFICFIVFEAAARYSQSRIKSTKDASEGRKD